MKYRLAAAATMSIFALSAHAAGAQETCPSPHADYRRPTPVLWGFYTQVKACPGDRVYVVAKLIVSPTAPEGMIQIPQSLPWHVDISGLAAEQINYLRKTCQPDLPCVSHFRITVTHVTYPRPEVHGGQWLEGVLENGNGGGQLCENVYNPEAHRLEKRCTDDYTNPTITATLDGWD
jgi:hypothetical protein